MASRTREKAEAFAAELAKDAKILTYEEIVADPQVQVMYIPLPTGLRKEWILKAARNNKHVLSEKPLAANARDARAIVDACSSAGVQLMDGTMFMHNERTTDMHETISDTDSFGAVGRVVSSFTVPFPEDFDNIRVKRAMEPLGCLGDLGWYCARISLWAYDYDEPDYVMCHFHDETAEGVPLDCTSTMRFSGGRTAIFDCSFKHSLRQSAQVVGSKKMLSVNDFVVPSEKTLKYEVSEMRLGTHEFFPNEVLKAAVEPVSPQQVLMVQKMSAIAASGNLEEFWPKIAMQTQVLMGALVASARREGAWVAPREPAASKTRVGTKTRPVEDSPVTLRKATFTNVCDLHPESKGVNLQVKVVSVKEVPGANPMAEVVLGDASGTVTFIARGDHLDLLKEGVSCVMRNSSVRMFNGHIRLQVDRWGKVEASEDFDFEVDTSKDMSSTEYELVEGDH